MAVRPEDLADALITRHRAAREGYERRGAALRRALEEAIAQARSAGTITGAWLIGSLARGDFGAASDVDVVVEGLAVEAFAPPWFRASSKVSTSLDAFDRFLAAAASSVAD